MAVCLDLSTLTFWEVGSPLHWTHKILLCRGVNIKQGVCLNSVER